MADTLLEMRAIGKQFPGVRALDHVSLAVRQGDVHAICGENGAGKSTLIKVLAGIHPHGTYDGEVLLDGEPVAFSSVNDSEARGVVVIHQELALIGQLSIAENIFLGNEEARRGVIAWHETAQRAQALLKRVGLDEHPLTRVGDLGVGKQQLVEIAKALSKDVRLLILDEPTAALNEDDSQRLLKLILELKEQGISCILISHKLGEITAVADEITVIRDGRTVESMRVADGGVDEARIIRGMVGRDLEHRFPERTPKIGDVVLSVRDWTVFHPVDHERKVVNDASLDLRAGEIVGLAGLMGAGRTELAMSLFGHSYGHGVTGTVTKDGREVSMRSVPAAVANGLAYATEDRKHFGLNLLDTISGNISLSRLDKLRRGLRVDHNRESEVAEGYRKSMNIKAPTVAEIVGRLSGGNQQKVVLSKWLFSDPDVLILDEPTRGIDVGAKYEIYTIINELAAAGKALLVISSELPELLGMCDRIYTMSQGRITGEFPREQADQEVLMRQMTKEREQEVVEA